jgi:hypothetical protein
MRSSRRSARITFGFACSVQVLVAAAYYRLTDGCFCVVDGVGPAVAWAPALAWVVRIGAYPLSLLPIRLYDPALLAHLFGWQPLLFPDWLFLTVALLTNLQLWSMGLLGSMEAIVRFHSWSMVRLSASRPAA